jgi:hypothetical protein
MEFYIEEGKILKETILSVLGYNSGLLHHIYQDKGCSKRFSLHYFSQPLTKIEKCNFEGLKSDVSHARIPSFKSFQQIAKL